MDTIIRDKDGDLWEETAPGKWKCRTTEDYNEWTVDLLGDVFGPLQFFGRINGA